MLAKLSECLFVSRRIQQTCGLNFPTLQEWMRPHSSWQENVLVKSCQKLMNKTPSQISHVDANGSTGESIDQIREILFGSQSRTIDDRFDKLNDRMSEAIGGLRSLLTERTDAISQRLEKEMHHLRGELEESRDDADQKRSDLNERLNSITNDLRQQVGSLSENLSAAERSLRSDMDNGLSALKQQLISQMDTVRDQLDANISQVSNASVARKSLSAALRELSERIDAD